jgi:hypothetical protein
MLTEMLHSDLQVAILAVAVLAVALAIYLMIGRRYPIVFKATFRLIGLPLFLFAGAYRLFAFKFRTFGGWLEWLVTLLGTVCLVAIALHENIDGFDGLAVSAAVCIAGIVKILVAFFTPHHRRDPGRSHFWFGWWLEPFVALGGAFALYRFGYGDLGGRIALGYVCSTAQILLVRLRHKLLGRDPEPTGERGWPVYARFLGRIFGPPLAGVGRALAIVGRGFSSAFSVGARVAVQPIKVAGRTAMIAGRVIPAVFVAKGERAYRPTFMGRVSSFLVAHLLLALITGAIGIGAIFKFGGKIIVIICALIIHVAGGDPRLPDDGQPEEQRYIDGPRDFIAGKRDAFREGWDSRKPMIKQGVEERVKDTRQGISDAGNRAAAKTAEEVDKRKPWWMR